MSNSPSPGTEGYWTKIDQYSPEVGDLARIAALDSEPAVLVVEVDHSDDLVDARLLADIDPERVRMLRDADEKRRRGLVAPIRTSLERKGASEFDVPVDDLERFEGGESA